MSVFVVLDILLLILIALPIPIGFWRGAQREAFVTLGILFGAALADWWARPWGGDLAAMTGLRDTAGAFMVAMLFLVGGTFLLGYGTGAALPMPPSGMISRVFGGLIAGANSALLFSFTLRNIRIFLLADQEQNFLNNTHLARFLSTGVGWILMGAAVIFVPVVLALALFGPSTILVPEYGEDELEEEDEFDAGYTPPARRVPPRVAAGVYDLDTTYKAEPARSSRYAPSEETREMAAQPSGRIAVANGGGMRRQVEEPQAVIARATPPTDAELERNGNQETRELPRVVEAPVPPEVREESLRAGKCPGCHADIRDAEVFCPNCGRVL